MSRLHLCSAARAIQTPTTVKSAMSSNTKEAMTTPDARSTHRALQNDLQKRRIMREYLYVRNAKNLFLMFIVRAVSSIYAKSVIRESIIKAHDRNMFESLIIKY